MSNNHLISSSTAGLKVESSAVTTLDPKLKMEKEVKYAEEVEGKEKLAENLANNQEEEIGKETDLFSGTAFPVKLDDGKQLNCIGLRKKFIAGFSARIYSFGIYADNEKLRVMLKSSFGGSLPKKPSDEMYWKVIDSDVEFAVRIVLLLPTVPVFLMRRADGDIAEAIKKLGGSKDDRKLNERITRNIASDIKLTHGSLIETTRLPGYTLRTIVKGQLVSEIKSEILCRAFCYMYLGEDPLDKAAKEKFGTSVLKLH